MSVHDVACPTCRAPVSSHLMVCETCDPALAEMPAIYITTAQYGRIENYGHIGLPPEHPAGRMIIDKLERSIVCRPEDIPADVVTMNSRILFRIDDAETMETRVLVYPEQYYPTGQYLSLGTPLGAALLGLREGSRIPFTDLQGARRTVLVERVAYQPGANAPDAR